MVADVGVAILGTGFIGRVHAKAARLNGARVVGVAASTPERAREACLELGADRADDAEALVEAPDIDVVHVATPNHLHESLAVAALKAGKHVICEKPLAFDTPGALRIADAAESAGRIVAVPFVYRFHPVVRQGREMVERGDLGTIRLLHGSYQQDWMSSAGDWSWRVEPDVGGPSRVFADIGSHWCDLVEFVTGHRITKVFAHLTTAIGERTAGSRDAFAADSAAEGSDGAALRTVSTEDVAMVLFQTDRGVPGSVVVSQISPGRKNRLWFEVDGAASSMVFDQEDSEHLWLGARGSATTLTRDPTTMVDDAARLSTLPAGHAQGYQDCFDNFVADAYAAMSGDIRPGLPLVADGVRSTRITDAVLASASTNAWEDVHA